MKLYNRKMRVNVNSILAKHTSNLHYSNRSWTVITANNICCCRRLMIKIELKKVNWPYLSENETIPYYRNSYTITSSNPNKWIATSFKFFRWLGCLIKLWESNLEVSKEIIYFIHNVVKNDKNVKENFVDCPKLLSLVNSEKCFTPSLKLIWIIFFQTLATLYT